MTGDASFGANRSTAGDNVPGASSGKSGELPVTDTFVFSVDAFSAERNVSFAGFAFALI